MHNWRIHKNRFSLVYIDGMDIVIDDIITGCEIERKTVSNKMMPFIDSMFNEIIELAIDVDVILKYANVSNTKYRIKNGSNPSFYFPKYVKELVECCYIVAQLWGATLEEIGWGISGYQVKFNGLGEWVCS